MVFITVTTVLFYKRKLSTITFSFDLLYSHVAANSFLDTEISVLRRVKAQLEIDLSSMTKVTASIVSGSPRGRGTKVTFEFEEYGDDEL